jgi:carboxypeptidase family protein
MKAKTPSQLLLPTFQAIVCAIVVAACSTSDVFGQNTTTGIRGIVRDQAGAVVPKTAIKLTDNATGIEYTTVSSSDGGFLIPNLQSGAYKLTASATGFQTAVYPSIVVDSGRTTNVSVDLQVGTTSEVVQVTASDTRLDTTTNEVGTTINNKLVQNLPYNGRESLNFAGLMAGNSQANSQRNSTFNGLPNASLNISLDGMNNNSQRFKSGGTSFFAFAPARIDAIEEVTVSTTGLGAEAGGQGAMQIRLTTKRGTEKYHGQILYQLRNEALNANTFFNNLAGRPRDRIRENDAVGSIGGPLLPFIPYLKGKLFFFAYYEAVPQPGTQNSSTRVLSPDAQQGIFTYFGTDGAKHSVNLLQVPGAQNAIDPTIAGILKSINDTRASGDALLDIPGIAPEFQRTMQWSQATSTETYYPTVRLDYHITPNVGWHGTWNLRNNKIAGRPPYPGNPYPFAPNQTPYQITTYVATNAVDWTIKPNMVNNLSFGIQSNGEYFSKGAEPQQYSVYGNRIINIPEVNNTALINPFVPSADQQPFIRNNPVYQFTDNLSWVKGRHTLTLGGTLLHTSFYERSYDSAGVPEYEFGVEASDPVNEALRNALPNINTNTDDINNALALYALLTGRITSISISTNVDEKTKTYSQFAPVTQRFAFTTAGVYAQDSFRLNPELTLNFGLRWQFDGSIHSTNGINSEAAGSNFYGPSFGLFQPGILSGVRDPGYVQVSNPYKRDFVNPAPNVGFAWNPSRDKGFLGKILGERKTVIRGAYSITFYNEGMNAISNVLTDGQGTTQNGSYTNGVNFLSGTLDLRSAAPQIAVFPETFSFPIPQSAFSSPQIANFINPNLVSPYTQNWTLGIQRELARNIVLEVRYVGNKSTHMWHYQNMQETNIFENRFLDQFIQAKRNLDINVARGRGQTFRNNGFDGQASIPIFEAAFGALGNSPAVSGSQGFSSSAFIQNLRQGTAGTLANTLATDNTYFCRMVGNKMPACATAGFTTPGSYPINFFRANPFVGNMNYQDSNGDANYNALQIDLRHQYGHGLLLGANYTWAHSMGDILNRDDQTAGYVWYTLRNARLNYGPTPFDRRHVFNAFWTYDLPFGKGRKFSAANPVIDRLIGGWTLGGRETIASGDPTLLNGGRNTVNNLSQAGVVFGGDFTPEQLQKALSSVAGSFSSTALISNVEALRLKTGAVNPALYAPASTPGQYAAFAFLRNNTSYQLDLSVNKEIRINERMRLTLRAVALNFLNHPFFALGNTSPTSTSFGQIARADGNRTVQLRASFDW